MWRRSSLARVRELRNVRELKTAPRLRKSEEMPQCGRARFTRTRESRRVTRVGDRSRPAKSASGHPGGGEARTEGRDELAKPHSSSLGYADGVCVAVLHGVRQRPDQRDEKETQHHAKESRHRNEPHSTAHPQDRRRQSPFVLWFPGRPSRRRASEFRAGDVDEKPGNPKLAARRRASTATHGRRWSDAMRLAACAMSNERRPSGLTSGLTDGVTDNNVSH